MKRAILEQALAARCILSPMLVLPPIYVLSHVIVWLFSPLSVLLRVIRWLVSSMSFLSHLM